MKEKKEVLKLDARALHHIRDMANKIWQRTRKPNANLIMYEALKQFMIREGYEPPAFEVPNMEVDA